MNNKYDDLTPKNGHTLKVLLICRVSNPEKEQVQNGTPRRKPRIQRRRKKQDERSLQDQEHSHREWLEQNAQWPLDIRVIAGSGSGELLDRNETREAEDAVETGEYDLVLCEDLGRIFRRMQAFQFCELAEDQETRVIAFNDHVDTSEDDWRLCAFFASMRHEMYNADTAKRIRRSHRNRFLQGNVFQCEIYGYIKPDPVGDKPISDEDVRKDESAKPVYDEWFRRLEHSATYSEVGDWLNDIGVPPGPYCRKTRWDGRMVARVTHNPILKGLRLRNVRKSKRVNKTGHRRSVKSPPEDILERHCPHLAFIEPERYDRVIAMLKERNRLCRRGRKSGRDPRHNVSRKRTRLPGQMCFCKVCGRLYVFGGHGQTDHLMCQGAREYKCWCGSTIDGPLAAAKIAETVSREIEALADFDELYLATLNEEARHANESLNQSICKLDSEIARVRREIENVLAEIRRGTCSTFLRKNLEELEEQDRQLQLNRMEAERTRASEIVLPSADELKQLYRERFRELAIDSFEFAREMRRLVPRVVVFPVRLCDGGHVVLRASFQLRLAALIPDVRAQEAVFDVFDKVIEVDLFNPPQRELHRRQVVALRESGLTQREVAGRLGITVTAAQHAAALQRLMDGLGLTDPYMLVTEPPADCPKLRRHLHPRYKFEPLDNPGEL